MKFGAMKLLFLPALVSGLTGAGDWRGLGAGR